MDEYYFMRFVAHRPTFAADMSPHEKETMGRHVAYWSKHVASGTVLVFGPVIDPSASWGLAILRVASEADAWALTVEDPARELGRHEILRMPIVVRP